jgi:peptidoglycan/LPS O-acetylase OafA/YrhL
VEEQFYLLWPLLVYWLSRRHLKIILCLVIFIAPVVRFLLARHLVSLGIPDRLVGTDVYMFTFSQFDAFAFGALIPVFQLGERLKRTGAWASALVGGSLGIGLLNYLLLRKDGVDVPASTLGLPNAMIAHYQHVWSYTLVDLMFMVLIIHLISPGYQGFFNHPLLVNPGKIVYGIYILHVPIMHFVRDWGSHYPHYRWLFFVLSCGLSWLAAALSYRFIEKRFLDLKGRIGVPKQPETAGLASGT